MCQVLEATFARVSVARKLLPKRDPRPKYCDAFACVDSLDVRLNDREPILLRPARLPQIGDERLELERTLGIDWSERRARLIGSPADRRPRANDYAGRLKPPLT